MSAKRKVNRRQFVGGALTVSAGAALAACAPKAAPSDAPQPEATQIPEEAQATEPTTAVNPDLEQIATDESNRNLEQITRLSESKVTFEGFSSPLYVATDVKTFNDQLFDKKMEELTNVHISWTAAPEWGDAPLELLMAGGDLPDLIAGYSPKIFNSYGLKGAIEPLNDYIDSNPYLSAIFKKHPEVRGAVTAPDGKIYCWPRYLEGRAKAFAGWFVRQDWLDELNLEAPDDLDQVYEVLKAFKARDANCKPYTRDPRAFIWAYGVGSRGPNCMTDFYHEGDVVKYGPIQPQYREALVYINKLFSEGLIDDEYEQSMSSDDFFFKRFIDGLSGLSMQWSIDGIAKPLYAQDPKAKLAGIPAPKGPYGHREVLSNHFAIDPTMASAMTVQCQNKEILAKYMDLYYSDSGAILMNWGIYGDTYIEQDGKRVYTDKVAKDEKLMPAEYLWNWVSPFWIGAMITTEDAQEATYGPIGADLQAWGVWSVEPWQTIQMPPLYLTQEEEDIVKPIMIDIDTFVDENTNGFIKGTKSLDKDYEDMVSTIRGRGIDEVTQIYQAAYDRYLAAVKAAQ